MGGLRPIPRKLSAVSASTMLGMAKVTVTMIWLVNDGIRCRKIILVWLAPGKSGRKDKFFVSEGYELSPHHSRQIRPTDKRQDYRNDKVDL